MKDYASPIEMITNSIIKSDEEQLEDCMLFSVEREIGFKVDKEELIKALEYDRKQYEKGFEDGLKSAVDWIPVSERLPEDYTEVIVTVQQHYEYEKRCSDGWELADDIGYFVFPQARYSKEYGWEWAYEAGADYWTSLDGVIAWMPLPKEYKPKEENK